MKAFKNNQEFLALCAEEQGSTKEEIAQSLLYTWEHLCQDSDPLVREFGLCMEKKGKPPLPARVAQDIATMIQISDMIPFSDAGYSEADYYRFKDTELASALRSKYSSKGLNQLAMERFIRLRRAGKV